MTKLTYTQAAKLAEQASVTINKSELEALKKGQRKAFLFGVLFGLLCFVVIPAIF